MSPPACADTTAIGISEQRAGRQHEIDDPGEGKGEGIEGPELGVGLVVTTNRPRQSTSVL